MAAEKKTTKKAVKAAAKKNVSRRPRPKGGGSPRPSTSVPEPVEAVEVATAAVSRSEVQEKAREISLDSFFQNLANSVLKAQKDLDQKSDEYNRLASGHPLVSPTVFKMPKVKASIRFAFSESNEEGFNILLFRKGRSSGFESEQTIDFEIAAAPPPPDAMKALQSLTPRIDPVLDPALRKRLLDLLQSEPNSSGHPGLKVNVTNRLVFIPSGIAGEFFGFAADKQTPQKFSMWRANVAEERAELMFDRDPLVSAQSAAGITALIGFLKGSLTALQDKQEQFFAAIQ